MNVRDTSKEAFVDLKEKGVVSRQSQSILNLMKKNQDYSMQELSKATEFGINAVSARCNELKKSGHLIENPKRKCSITNRTVNPLKRVA
jgi:predicted transcriptional regulator